MRILYAHAGGLFNLFFSKYSRVLPVENGQHTLTLWLRSKQYGNENKVNKLLMIGRMGNLIAMDSDNVN